MNSMVLRWATSTFSLSPRGQRCESVKLRKRKCEDAMAKVRLRSREGEGDTTIASSRDNCICRREGVQRQFLVIFLHEVNILMFQRGYTAIESGPPLHLYCVKLIILNFPEGEGGPNPSPDLPF